MSNPKIANSGKTFLVQWGSENKTQLTANTQRVFQQKTLTLLGKIHS